jgi:hypothetical protein
VKKLGPVDQLRACYEAGPTDYVLYWQMTQLGVEGSVIAQENETYPLPSHLNWYPHVRRQRVTVQRLCLLFICAAHRVNGIQAESVTSMK